MSQTPIRAYYVVVTGVTILKQSFKLNPITLRYLSLDGLAMGQIRVSCFSSLLRQEKLMITSGLLQRSRAGVRDHEAPFRTRTTRRRLSG